jgi:cytochrome c oxidase assembly protein subunit 15
MADGGEAPQAPSRHAVALWLLASAAFVFAVLVVGGLTRLQRAGLSIVQWQPVAGVVPPLSDADWAAAFEQYRATPEFRLLNPAMTLAQFQQIYWWEYAHRLLARLDGAVFLLPFLWFLATRRIGRALAWRLALIFALGALQGALGWFMVASGLVDDPHVSPLRLSAHLGLAWLLIGAMLWNALALWREAAPADLPGPHVRRLALFALAAVYAMSLSGGLMSGARAGLGYNSFPLMDGYLVPPDLLRLSPWHLNLWRNPACVQFVHRLLALVVALALLWLGWAARRNANPGTAHAGARLPSLLMLGALALQLGLGVATLLTGVALPLAAAHQAGGVALFASTLWTVFALLRTRRDAQAAASVSAAAAPMSSAR